MKPLRLLFALIGLSAAPALAQQPEQPQPPQMDPQLAMCRQMSLEKEDRLGVLNKQAVAIVNQLEQTKAQLEAATKEKDAAIGDKKSLENELESTKAELAKLKDSKPTEITPRASQ